MFLLLLCTSVIRAQALVSCYSTILPALLVIHLANSIKNETHPVTGGTVLTVATYVQHVLGVQIR